MPTFRFWMALVLALICVTDSACQRSRLSGTYIAHGDDFAEMLQLTETDGGQIKGTFSLLGILDDGKIKSEQDPVAGTADGGQLTLTFNPGLFASNLAGSLSWNTIKLQGVGSKGEFLSWTFARSSPEKFKSYADQLKLRADGIKLSNSLLKNAQNLQGVPQGREPWISNAQAHAQRIPGLKEYYDKIEATMQSLVTREHSTADPVARGQLSVQVSQGDVAGAQADVQVNQLWDQSIGDSGQQLHQALASYGPACRTQENFEKRGATKQAIGLWESGCKQLIAGEARFESVFNSITEQRTDLRAFQKEAQSRRQALVREANRIE